MHIPKFKLRSLFAVVLCLAVGFTCGFAPHKDKRFFALPDAYYAVENWQIALLATASVAIMIGLVQQVRQLFAFQRSFREVDGEYRFALSFAIGWRVLIVLLIGLCLVVQLLVTRRVFELPESEGLLFIQAFPAAVWNLSVIVVLVEILRRRSGTTDSPRTKAGISLLGWIAAATFALIVLPQTTLVHFLVHVATAGIESHRALQFQRQGTFPNHQSEGFRLFWLSAAAAISIVIAAWCWFSTGGYRPHWGRNHLIRSVALATATLYSLAFVVWFYSVEFFRISPDMAGVLPSGGWLDLLGGGMILAVAITAAASRMSVDREISVVVQSEVAAKSSDRFFHESLLLVGLLVPIFALDLVLYGVMTSSISSFFGQGISLIDVAYYLLSEPQGYFDVALPLLGLGIGIRMWRQRGVATAWRINDLPAKTFAWNWLVTAALAIIAIPAIGAYCFSFWLGPWYLFGS